MNINRLLQILEETTSLQQDSEKTESCFPAFTVNMALAQERREEILEILNDWPAESWGQSIPKLEQGPSYITVGAVLGDQEAALRLFALGQAIKLWEVITPESMGLTGQEAVRLAQMGFIMIGGFKSM